uniref:Uncharacterized protein n=1 Tax=Arundo donax TaxID=35708 RepID=A0A0A9AGD4_ARUDO
MTSSFPLPPAPSLLPPASFLGELGEESFLSSPAMSA